MLFCKNLSGKAKQRKPAIWNTLHWKQILSAKLRSLAVVKQTEKNKIIVKKSSSLPMETQLLVPT